MHERERNQTTDTSTLSYNSQQWQQLTRWEIQNGIHRTRCMRGRENQTTDTSTLSNNRQQRQQLTSWEIQNGIHRTRCMRGRENQTTDTSTLSNNRQQRQQLTSWEIQNGIHRTWCMRGREIKQQTHQHWVTTVNNDNNLPTGWFKMAFTEHDAWEGEKSNNRHINTE